MERKIWLDLDRTLFRTTQGVDAIWRVLEQAYPDAVSAQMEIARQSDFYEQDETAYVYDFTAHMQSLGIDVDDAYGLLRNSSAADGQLEHEGAKELVDYARSVGEVAVLTYGEDRFQRLKASLCPSVEGSSIVTVREPKAVFLEGEQNTWLVDDKPIGNELSDGVRLIQVTQEGQVKPDAMWPVATSLSEVTQILQREIAHEEEGK